jgi:uncharacterized protein
MKVKIHLTENKRIILAVCDSNLVGQKFEEGEKQLDLTTNFYNGCEKTNQEISDLMRNSYMINLVGEKSIDLALSEEIISKENVKKVSGIPYSQITMGED